MKRAARREQDRTIGVGGILPWLIGTAMAAVPASAAPPADAGHADDRGPCFELIHTGAFEDSSGHALDAFHAALLRAARGEGQAHLIFYGASHTASDTYTAVVRRRLQARFGDAGHGLVLPALPWRGYRHSDVNIDGTLTWRADRARRTDCVHDGLYGVCGVSLATSSPRDYASVSTTLDNPFGRYVSRFELFYLAQPGGGSFDVFIDGRRNRRIDTAALSKTGRRATFRVPDGGHRLDIVPVGNGEVRIFAVALDRDAPGVRVDVAGINGAQATVQLGWNEELWAEQLAARTPDLVVLAYGTNESANESEPVETYEARLEQVVARVRRAVPKASCLLIGPSDHPTRQDGGKWGPRPRTAAIVAAQRRIAREHGCAYFDLVTMMGGPMSMIDWVRHDPPCATRDHIHFTMAGYRAMGHALTDALLRGFSPPQTSPPADK